MRQPGQQPNRRRGRLLAGSLALAGVAVLTAAARTGQASSPVQGGADLLGGDAYSAFWRPKHPAVRIEPLSVQGLPFAQAWRFTGLAPTEHPWTVQIGAPTRALVQQGDTLLVQFWARSVGGPAQTEFVLEQGGPPYAKDLTLPLRLKPVWTHYSVPFRARRTDPPGGANALFRLGYAGQTFELGGVVLKNFGPGWALESLPRAGG